jgi:hypothetical protein
MKHFFVARHNNLETVQFYEFKKNLVQLFEHKSLETMEEINKYYKRFDWNLNMSVFDFESVIAMSMNFNIIPQCVLILRNVFSINNPLNGKDFF